MTLLTPQWSADATDSLNIIMEYLFSNFGITSVINLQNEIDRSVTTLITNPMAGKKELILEGKQFDYRSIVVNSVNKLVYRIEGNILYIVDIWDMRRSTENLAKGKE